MFKVILEIASGEFRIVKKSYNHRTGYLTMYYGSRPACKAWIDGHKSAVDLPKLMSH